MANNLLRKISNIAGEEKVKLYLVGGFLRSLVLGVQTKTADVDIVVSGAEIYPFVKKVKKRLDGTLIPLDNEKGIFRIAVKDEKNGRRYVDFTALKGSSLETDLKKRDFTINSMAVDLAAYIGSGKWRDKIIDPTGGLRDVEHKKIRAVSKDVFLDDSLRLLRAVRFCAQLGFTLEENTKHEITAQRCLLKNNKGERLRDELWKIMDEDVSYPYIILLEEELKLLTVLFPEIKKMRAAEQNYFHGEDVWNHCLRTYRILEKLINRPPFESEIVSEVNRKMEESFPSGRKRKHLLKFFALFHDVGKIKTKKILRSGRIIFHGHEVVGVKSVEKYSRFLKLSSKEKKILKNFMKQHMRPLFLNLVGEKASRKAYHKFFNNLGEETLDILLHSLADFTAKREAKNRKEEIKPYLNFIQELLCKYYYQRDLLVSPPILVSGKEVMELLKIKPSPEVGYILKKISEAQVEGIVSNRSEALEYAVELKSEK